MNIKYRNRHYMPVPRVVASLICNRYFIAHINATNRKQEYAFSDRLRTPRAQFLFDRVLLGWNKMKMTEKKEIFCPKKPT